MRRLDHFRSIVTLPSLPVNFNGTFTHDAHGTPLGKAVTRLRVGYLSGVILVIFDPCKLMPPIRPF
jgi:hypothetical protein